MLLCNFNDYNYIKSIMVFFTIFKNIYIYIYIYMFINMIKTVQLVSLWE